VMTIVVFASVLALNIIPIFAPPTWLVLSAIAVHYKISNILLLAFTGASAATLGRIILAKLSNRILRGKLLSERSKKNIDDLKKHLEKRRTLTFSIFLFYAFSPLPSSQLFIAYGLTNLPLRSIALPFFLGRITSYTLLSFTISEVAKGIATSSFFSFYFLITQCLTILTVYLFVRIDWHTLFAEKKMRFIKR
jgi:hypothetical protein